MTRARLYRVRRVRGLSLYGSGQRWLALDWSSGVVTRSFRCRGSALSHALDSVALGFRCIRPRTLVECVLAEDFAPSITRIPVRSGTEKREQKPISVLLAFSTRSSPHSARRQLLFERFSSPGIGLIADFVARYMV